VLAVAAVLLALWPALTAPAVAPPDLRGGLVVAYTPLGYAPDPSWRPRAAGLRADADSLRRIGAVAVVTERSTRALAPVCRFLKRRGIRTVIVGVADPTDAAELRVARRLRRCADGYAVGSGGLVSRRYARRSLERAVAALRRDTGRPVAVRERIESYRADPGLLRLGDWVFPLVDADPRHGAQEACGATMQAYQTLRARVPPDRRVVVAAAGLPTAVAPAANEHAQRAYLTCLASRDIPFVLDEAYDQPWRGGAGATRGVFRADGTPKRFAARWRRP